MNIGAIGCFRPSLNVISLHVKYYLGTLGSINGWLVEGDDQGLYYLGVSL